MLIAYKKFLTHLTDFSGHTSRKDYWSVILINTLISITVGLLFKRFNGLFTNITSLHELLFAISYQVFILGIWLATLSLKVRRLHDINRSGWWIILHFIPIIGNVILFWLLILPTKKQISDKFSRDSNQYLKIFTVVIIIISVSKVVFNNLGTYNDELYRASQVKVGMADQTPLLSNQQFKNEVQTYSHKTVSGKTPKGVHTVIIPGLHGAWSIDHKTKKVSFGDNWVPQGLAETPTQYFISAYDGQHQLNSVIYIIDKKSGQYQKSLILNRKAHVGGLAVDLDHQLLWVSDDTRQSAQVEALSFKTIKNYNFTKNKIPIKPTQVASLKWASRTSGLCYFKNNLLIVKYGENSNSRSIVDLSTDKKTGLIPSKTTQSVKIPNNMRQSASITQVVSLLKKQKRIRSYSPGYNRMQGVTTMKSKNPKKVIMIYSQSNGNVASDLIINRVDFNDYFKFNPKRISTLSDIKLPPSAEQVSADSTNKQVSVLFEGGARKYRTFKLGLLREPFIDRLIVFDY